MSSPDSDLYEFGPYRLDVRRRAFSRGEQVMPLAPKTFELLLLMLRNPGRAFSKQELMTALWPDTFVEEANLSFQISTLRKALGEYGARWIETVPKHGYRFAGNVNPSGGTAKAGVTKAGHWLMTGRRRRQVVTVTVAMLLTAGAVGVISVRRRTPPESPRYSSLWQLTFDAGLTGEPTWSPDGRFIAYSSDRGGNFDIWVKPVGEGDPVRVTKSAAHDWQPDWSPDGNWLVFRSEREGGGLSVVPALGGGERKVSGFGYRPRWSPDGSLILFYSSFLQSVSNLPRLYVVGLDGKPPREVLSEVLAGFVGQQTDLRVGWHPDGRRISIREMRRDLGWGFWTVPLTGGPPVKSELAPQVERQFNEASVEFNSFAWAPSGRALYFEGTAKGVKNVWKVVVDPETLRWTAGPHRLTIGAGRDAEIALSRDGRKLALTTRIERTRLWSIPFDAAAGRIIGTGKPATAAGLDVLDFDLSRDGRELAFVVSHGDRQELRKKSLTEDGDTVLVPSDGMMRNGPRWSPEGKQLAYSRRLFANPERTAWERATVLLPVAGGDERVLASIRSGAGDWSADGAQVLGMFFNTSTQRIGIASFPISAAPHAENEMRVLASDSDHNLYQPRFSPDGRSLTFNAVKPNDSTISTIYVISASGGEWTRVTDGRYWDDKGRWSPDGRTIYFVSNRGGSYNVWGTRLDPKTGKPSGDAFRITSFEAPALIVSPVIGDIEMALAADTLVLPILEAWGNIWILENVDR